MFSGENRITSKSLRKIGLYKFSRSRQTQTTILLCFRDALSGNRWKLTKMRQRFNFHT